MKNRYKKAFDEISPIRSDEELLRAVLDRKAENMKATQKIGKKAVIIPVAAVMLAAATVGVGAAYQWDLSAAFEGLFRNRNENANLDMEFNVGSDIDFSRIGTEIGESWSGEGYTLTIEGAVADERNAYFYYTLAFGEDFPCDYAHEDVREGTGKFDWLIDLNTVELVSDGEPLNIGATVGGNDCKWLDENTVQGVFSVYSSETSLTDRELTLTVGGIFRDKVKDGAPFDRQEVTCGLSVELFFDGDSVYKPVMVEPNEKIGNGMIDELTVSSFSAEYILSGDLNFMDPALSYLSLTLRDGTVIELSDMMSSTADGKIQCHVNFLYPVNPAEVASFRIGETVVDLTDR